MTVSSNAHPTPERRRATWSPFARRLRHAALAAAVAGGGAAMVVASAGASAAAPTCSDSDIVDVAVHGEHVVGDYVTGTGHDALAWPPAGQVGAHVGSDGPAYAGGPGPAFHFELGIAPGASFCVPQASSPGFPHGR